MKQFFASLPSTDNLSSTSASNSLPLASNVFNMTEVPLLGMINYRPLYDVKNNHVKSIIGYALKGDTEALKKYLKLFKIDINAYDYYRHRTAGYYLAICGFDESSPALAVLFNNGAHPDQMALGYAAGKHAKHAQRLVINGIQGVTANVSEVARGYAIGGHRSLAENCVTVGINGKKASIKDIAEGYALMGHKRLAESCVTKGVNGQKVSVDYISIHYAIGGHESILKRYIRYGIKNEKADIKDIAYGYAFGGHRALAVKCVSEDMSEGKATMSDIIFGFAAGGHRTYAKYYLNTTISGKRASVSDVAFGFAVSGYYEDVVKCCTTGFGGQVVSIFDVHDFLLKHGLHSRIDGLVTYIAKSIYNLKLITSKNALPVLNAGSSSSLASSPATHSEDMTHCTIISDFNLYPTTEAIVTKIEPTIFNLNDSPLIQLITNKTINAPSTIPAATNIDSNVSASSASSTNMPAPDLADLTQISILEFMKTSNSSLSAKKNNKEPLSQASNISKNEPSAVQTNNNIRRPIAKRDRQSLISAAKLVEERSLKRTKITLTEALIDTNFSSNLESSWADRSSASLLCNGNSK